MFTTQIQLFDPAEVERAVRLLTEPDQVFEVRALKATTSESKNFRTTYSGYFNAVEPVLTALETIRTAEGIYYQLAF